MRVVLFICFLSMFAFAKAQKIKIKKDIVLLDGKEVAIAEKQSNSEFDFKDLSGNQVFNLKFKADGMSTGQVLQWLVVTADDDRKAEIEYEVLISSLNFRKVLVHLLMTKYGIFDLNGINTEKLDVFFAENKEELTETYTKAAAADDKWLAEHQTKIEQVRTTINPQVNMDGSISFRNRQTGGRAIVGRLIDRNNSPDPFRASMAIVDLDNIEVARLKSRRGGGGMGKYDVTTYDNVEYLYEPEDRYNKGDRGFNHRFVLDLVARGYNLGHEARAEMRALQNQKVDLAIDRSINLYNVPGYVVDKDGKKYKGDITIEFELIDVNETGQNTIEDGNDYLGKRLVVSYLNEKGRPRKKTIPAKDNGHFCISYEDSTEDCYYGMGVQGDALKKLQNISSLSFNNSYYYLSMYKSDKIHLLQDPVDVNRFVIKLPDEKKGQMIDGRNSKKLNDVLADYLSRCKTLSKEIRDGAFDLKIEENLRQICKEYEMCN